MFRYPPVSLHELQKDLKLLLETFLDIGLNLQEAQPDANLLWFSPFFSLTNDGAPINFFLQINALAVLFKEVDVSEKRFQLKNELTTF